jgi:hypothetical protein
MSGKELVERLADIREQMFQEEEVTAAAGFNAGRWEHLSKLSQAAWNQLAEEIVTGALGND